MRRPKTDATAALIFPAHGLMQSRSRGYYELGGEV